MKGKVLRSTVIRLIMAYSDDLDRLCDMTEKLGVCLVGDNGVISVYMKDEEKSIGRILL